MSIKRLLLQAIYHCKYGPFLHDETWIWRSHPPPPLHLCVRVASGPWKVLRPPAIVCATYSCNLSIRKLLTKSAARDQPGCALLVAACPKLARTRFMTHLCHLDQPSDLCSIHPIQIRTDSDRSGREPLHSQSNFTAFTCFYLFEIQSPTIFWRFKSIS